MLYSGSHMENCHVEIYTHKFQRWGGQHILKVVPPPLKPKFKVMIGWYGHTTNTIKSVGINRRTSSNGNYIMCL